MKMKKKTEINNLKNWCEERHWNVLSYLLNSFPQLVILTFFRSFEMFWISHFENMDEKLSRETVQIPVAEGR